MNSQLNGHALCVEKHIWLTMFLEYTWWKHTHIVVNKMSPESSVACAPPARSNTGLLVHLARKGVKGQPKQRITFYLGMESFGIIMLVSGYKYQMLHPSPIMLFDLRCQAKTEGGKRRGGGGGGKPGYHPNELWVRMVGADDRRQAAHWRRRQATYFSILVFQRQTRTADENDNETDCEDEDGWKLPLVEESCLLIRRKGHSLIWSIWSIKCHNPHFDPSYLIGGTLSSQYDSS